MKRYILLPLIIVISMAASVFAVNPLTGKNVAFLGDSMTWIGGDSCTMPRGWTCHFVKLAEIARADVYARSGATWTNAPATKVDTAAFYDILHDDNVMITQAVRLISDVQNQKIPAPDIIFLYAGANDVWFSDRRPMMFSNGGELNSDSLPLTLEGSIRMVCDRIVEVMPSSEIVLITPAQMSKSTPGMLKRVADIIGLTGEEIGVKVIRNDTHGPIQREQELTSPRRLTSDGIHTNQQGAEALARFILSAYSAACCGK